MFGNHFRNFLLGTTFTLVLIVSGNPCYAYYWGFGNGYGAYNLGSSLLWPVNSFMPYSSYGNSSYGLGWPLFNLFHASNRAYNNTSLNSYQNIPNTQSNNTANNYPVGARNSNSPFNSYTPNYSANTVPSLNQQPVGPQPVAQPSSPRPFNDPNDIFNSSYTPTPGLISSQPEAPPAAPDRHTNAQTTAQPNTPLPPQNTAALEGFFQVVNTRYKGDLLRALNQPDMQSWAQSLNLMDPSQKLPTTLNKARKSEISTILKDNTLEPYHKLDILHLLLF